MVSPYVYPILTTTQINAKEWLTVTDVIRETAKHFKLPVAAITGANRARKNLYPRYTAIYIARKICKDNRVSTIGKALNRDHTSVINALKVVTETLMNEQPFKEDYKAALRKVKTLGLRYRKTDIWE